MPAQRKLDMQEGNYAFPTVNVTPLSVIQIAAL
ncbi:hypothetical protein ANO14919_072920 [Xylariales sp. No.14919]|nr:hypothetical protein ANO14919_072920 [Xylariales sp. No.14919]